MIKETNFKNKQFSEVQEKLPQAPEYRSQAPKDFPPFFPLCFILLIEFHIPFPQKHTNDSFKPRSGVIQRYELQEKQQSG